MRNISGNSEFVSKQHEEILYFQRCIVMRLFYFSYKQVKHDFSLLSAYAIICGRFNITVN